MQHCMLRLVIGETTVLTAATATWVVTAQTSGAGRIPPP